MSRTSSSKAIMRDSEYQHYIPQFILMRFIPSNSKSAEPSPYKTKSQRKKEAWKAKKKGRPDPHSIVVFDMANRSVQTVAIRRWFGLNNFYQDTLYTENMRHLEDKLGVLENKAARIIENLHKATVQPENLNFTLVRSDLQILLRFIFIMHYRSSATEKTYLQEDHPGNVPVRNWIRKLKAENGYANDKQIWLRGLHYYLDTRHDDILAHATDLLSRNPKNGVPHAELDVNTPAEHWFALAYESLTSNYYMGIWQASDNAEFILGHNSYGLWEGTIGHAPQIFRIYVLSPTITLVLKSNLSKVPLFKAMESSTLSDHPLQLPRTTYNRPPRNLANPSESAQDRQRFDALQMHLQSTNAASDQFTFTINRLSADQTYLVNQVVLENLHADGSLVFKSKDYMLNTARRYDTPEGSFPKKNRTAIAALAACLWSPSPATTLPEDPAVSSPPTEPVSTPSAMRPRLLLDEALLSDVGCRVSEYDLAFDNMLRDILEGSMEFRSDYDRARYIYSLLPKKEDTIHPLALHVHRQMLRSSEYIEVMTAASGLSKIPMPTKRALVESLDRDEATHLLNLVGSHFEIWEKDWVTEEPKEDEGDSISKEVRALAYLQLLVDVDYRLAHKICHSVSFTKPVISRCDSAGQSQPMVHDVPPVQHCPATNNFLDESRANKEPDQSSAEVNQPFENGPGVVLSQGFVRDIRENRDIEEGGMAVDTGREGRPHDVYINIGPAGETPRDRQFSEEMGGTSPPAGRLVLTIVQLLLASLVHLGAAILTLVLELIEEVCRAIWRGARGHATDRPPNVVFLAPAFVGHLVTAVMCVYGALYLTGSLLFGFPVHVS